MNNEPVAWIRSGDLQLSLVREKDDGDLIWKPLYIHPIKELNVGGEPVKNATYWKRQYNLMATQNDNLKSGLYHANEQIQYLESHPVKELTDKEILAIAYKIFEVWNTKESLVDFARAILRKAQKK